MPTNLPPDYYEAEKRYREAKSPAEKIACLEEMMTIIPKHKGTDKLRADLRRRISKLKSAAQTKKGGGKRESVFRIDKEGAGQVAVAGPPNTGKSTLVAALTNAEPQIADFPGTTWSPTPGMMPVDDIQIQLVDTPPLNREYLDPELMDFLRRVDLMLLIVDLTAGTLQQLEDAVALLKENRIIPKHLAQPTDDRRPWFQLPFLIVAAKNDDADTEAVYEIFQELAASEWDMLPVSIHQSKNIEALKRRIVEKLAIIRVYAKTPGKKADLSEPFVLKTGSTISDFAEKVHRDFVQKLKSARVWGSSAFDGQRVQRDYILHDGDIVELQT